METIAKQIGIESSELAETLQELMFETTMNNDDAGIIHRHVSVLQAIYAAVVQGK